MNEWRRLFVRVYDTGVFPYQIAIRYGQNVTLFIQLSDAKCKYCKCPSYEFYARLEDYDGIMACVKDLPENNGRMGAKTAQIFRYGMIRALIEILEANAIPETRHFTLDDCLKSLNNALALFSG